MFLCSTSETPAAWYTTVSELTVIGAARPGIWNVRTVVPEAMRLLTRWRWRAAAAWWRAITSSTRRLRSPVTSTSEAKRSAAAPLQPAMRRMNGDSASPGSRVVRSTRREDGATATDPIRACGVTTALPPQAVDIPAEAARLEIGKHRGRRLEADRDVRLLRAQLDRAGLQRVCYRVDPGRRVRRDQQHAGTRPLLLQTAQQISGRLADAARPEQYVEAGQPAAGSQERLGLVRGRLPGHALRARRPRPSLSPLDPDSGEQRQHQHSRLRRRR